ncbi:g6103 [Coccomyxa viridis]|uniref:G6103 protein n=1 Tax=Coccomyxa viridis TaxID=1274662 RepID=A0ABP1FUJ9_9CHLO
MSTSLWAFDFDGVVCNSVGESSKSAWKASARKWPEMFSKPDVQAREAEIEQKMRTVRPVVETGYENLVQVRCLLEGVSEDDILQHWHTILPESMQRWQLDRQELVELFGSTRDAWMADNLDGWLAANEIYEGVPAIVQHLRSQESFYIVTTKQARFTEALMHSMAKVPIASQDIFSTTVSGQPKSEILVDLQRQHPDMTYHFVEDKLGTLEKVCKVDALSGWQLYLVDWGYNTAEERDRAARNPRIAVMSLQDLRQATGCS